MDDDIEYPPWDARSTHSTDTTDSFLEFFQPSTSTQSLKKPHTAPHYTSKYIKQTQTTVKRADTRQQEAASTVKRADTRQQEAASTVLQLMPKNANVDKIKPWLIYRHNAEINRISELIFLRTKELDQSRLARDVKGFARHYVKNGVCEVEKSSSRKS